MASRTRVAGRCVLALNAAASLEFGDLIMLPLNRNRFARWAFGRLSFALPALGIMLSVALAQAPNPAADSLMVAAQASFEALPEAERKAIQVDLIWTGHFNGVVSGSFGPLTFRAINALKDGRGPADGLLPSAERSALAKAAQAARDDAGFRLITDDKTGVGIGIPTKLLSRRDTTPSGGSRWQSEDGKVTLDTSTSPPGDELGPLFEKATAGNVQGRKITYKLLRPDFFVVTGETAAGRYYRRLAAGPAGLRGFSIGYDKALAASVDKLVIAIAASFEPFPTGPAPGAGAAIADGASPSQLPRAASRSNERYGVGLVLGDKVALSAAAAVDGCRSLRVGGQAAKLRAKDEASGLVLLDLDGTVAGKPPALRGEALGVGDALVLIAYGDDGGKRAAMALPGENRPTAGKAAVLAPLQPGQAGSPAFDRQGRLAGMVTANPSDRLLVAGVAPLRSHALADGAAIQAALAKMGLALSPASASTGSALSTGAVVEKVSGSVLPVECGL
ncbi:trypsin-like peptidase domain-containing protein [Microvirga terricola]|uniref:Trypsin-like peptidase domain-containing protein n=1 Tax=Microvirga terricola TaxID=2719797 RepID=A0ABX0VG47_9HYPH|nr:trypsin-like peptidase domain-containing protein [Microvirga terricola]NIX77715.1 trypsin-like peptidase domain-containing protein [Microvirga terricola]